MGIDVGTSSANCPTDSAHAFEPDRPGRMWTARLGPHAAALALVLLALLPIVDNGSVGFTDEGVYSAQAALLARGSWSIHRPAVDLDADGRLFAITSSEYRGNTAIPYARHPLYPLLLTPPYRLGGLVGLLLVSVAGTWVAAVAGAMVAGRLGQRLSVPTLWLLGVGSPLLFDAYTVIAHSLAAALAGILALCAFSAVWTRDRTSLQILDRPRAAIGPLLGAMAAAAALVGIRSEGTIVAGALGLVLVVQSLGLRRAGGSVFRWNRLTVGVAVVATTALAFLLDDRWADAITGTATAGSSSIDRRPDPLSAFWISLVRGWNGDNRHATATMMLVLVTAVLAPLCLRLLPRRPLLAVGLAVAGAGAAVVHLFERVDLISGLLAAMPALLMGLLFLSWRDMRRPPVLMLVGTTALATGIVLATSYREGGATEWGGRFFHVVLPLVVPVAILGLDRAGRQLPRSERATAAAAVVVMTLALSISAVRANVAYRDAARAVVTGATEFAKQVDGPHRPLVVYAPLRPTGASRIFWRQVIDGQEVITSGNLGGLVRMLPRLRSSRPAETAVVVTDVDARLVDYVLAGSNRSNGWRITDFHKLTGSSYFVARLEPPR